MGIKNFKKFLSTKIVEPVKKIYFNEVKIKSICIDINVFIYKYITAIRKNGKDIVQNGKIISHLIGLKNQINKFNEMDIDIIYVFDGKPPKQKQKILNERKLLKEKALNIYKEKKTISSFQQSFYITPEIIASAKEYIISRNIKYIDIDLEADIICAMLVKKKIVDCVYSTDFDILAYGANFLIINMDYKKKYFECINLKYLLKKLKISYEQFVDIIVLSGCDYCMKHKNMTLNKAYNIVLQNNNYIAMINENKELKEAKKIFMKKYNVSKSNIH